MSEITLSQTLEDKLHEVVRIKIESIIAQLCNEIEVRNTVLKEKLLISREDIAYNINANKGAEISVDTEKLNEEGIESIGIYLKNAIKKARG